MVAGVGLRWRPGEQVIHGLLPDDLEMEAPTGNDPDWIKSVSHVSTGSLARTVKVVLDPGWKQDGRLWSIQGEGDTKTGLAFGWPELQMEPCGLPMRKCLQGSSARRCGGGFVAWRRRPAQRQPAGCSLCEPGHG